MIYIAYISIVPFWLLGFLIFFFVVKGKKYPMDESNRINHIRGIWWMITKPEYFAENNDWMRKDEGDNLNI